MQALSGASRRAGHQRDGDDEAEDEFPRTPIHNIGFRKSAEIIAASSLTVLLHENRVVNQFLTFTPDTDDQTVSARPRNEA
jgi:hypothetical protein